MSCNKFKIKLLYMCVYHINRRMCNVVEILFEYFKHHRNVILNNIENGKNGMI